jgi:site-specific recombinase XerD
VVPTGLEPFVSPSPSLTVIAPKTSTYAGFIFYGCLKKNKKVQTSAENVYCILIYFIFVWSQLTDSYSLSSCPMTVNFYLAGMPTRHSEYTIRMYITAVPRGNRKPMTISTGRRVPKKDWDAAKQRVKQSYVGSPELNRFLDTLRIAVRRRYDEMCADLGAANVRAAHFKPEIIRLFTPPEETLPRDFIAAFEDFLQSQRTVIAVATIKKYTTLQHHLTAFQESTGFKLDFDTITLDFYDAFRCYLLEIVGLQNNTVNKTFSMLKTFLNWATQRKLNTCTDFRLFKIRYDDVDSVALSRSELLRLFWFDFSTAPTLDKVRDVFCFQCSTGQRFSDIASCDFQDIKLEIDPKTGKQEWFWFLRTHKTKTALKIPLNPFALRIVEKYRSSGKLPVISAQKTNQYLKEACKEVGIIEPVQRVMYRGNQRIEERQAKYEAISTHTARRTFVTLSLEGGMRPEVVMKITGHTDFKMLKKYIRLTDRAAAQEMETVWSMN